VTKNSLTQESLSASVQRYNTLSRINFVINQSIQECDEMNKSLRYFIPLVTSIKEQNHVKVCI